MTRSSLHRLWALAAGLLLAWPFGQAVAGTAEVKPEKPNLLSNASFETAGKDGPEGWGKQTWDGEAVWEHAAVGRTGKRSTAISSAKGADAAWKITARVEPHATYRLSGWIKTDNVQAPKARGALLNLHNLQPVATKPLTGTNDWTAVEVTFESGTHDAVQVNCLLGGWGLATGKAWFDDLRLEQLARKDWKPMITIDAAREGQPVSKYVYGQFIEHLGRCIYGGIWAEMLQDRKFYHAVGAKESPWKPLGPAGSLTMVRQGAFVGEHTPRVAAAGPEPRGVVQGELGLQKGRRYVGRVWLAGDASAAPVRVSLLWGDSPSDRQSVTVDKLAGEFARTELAFTAGGDSDEGRLEIASAGQGNLLVGPASLMPADNVQGMRADTLELLRQLDSPVYRWPGGNFVSGYNWRDGIGDRDRRPPRKNPAWKGVEHNDFGLDEFMVFCRLLRTEPYIAVNSGLGEADEAVAQLQYANAPAETPMGRLRAANGRAEPYAVRFWGIGNEMYGGWQLGHMPLEKYIQKHNVFAKAMRAADAEAKLVGVGSVGAWSQGMMTHCADHMDLISEHFYCGSKDSLAAHVEQVVRSVRSKADAHRRYRREIAALAGKDIRIALDEWNYWYGPHVYGELGTRYFLKDALGIAAGLNEMARHSDMFYMANYAQTVNVIGCIKTTKTAAAFATTGLPLMLYRHHFGTIPLATETDDVLSAQAAWTADRKTLTLAVVNPTEKPLEVPLVIRGAKLATSGERWQIAGDDPMAYNEPGKEPKVQIVRDRIEAVGDKLTLAPCSVTLIALPASP